jgi:hypothetical protein
MTYIEQMKNSDQIYIRKISSIRNKDLEFIKYLRKQEK